ncbi:MAG: PKD domain-containing protein, partial [Cyclobacteriaceae bacterium]|nr:PKD domain-containing protein [Cyclobacteriaceae bacterium]
VSAGTGLFICADTPSIQLNGSFGGSATGITWSGGLGSFDNNTIINPNYTWDPTEENTFVTLTITTDDPDGIGPCTSISDNVLLDVRPLPVIFITGTPPTGSIAENDDPILIEGSNSGGNFTIAPGSGLSTTIVSPPARDKVTFDPAAATLGQNFVTYTYTNPTSTCTNSFTESFFVNPATSIDFTVTGATLDALGSPQICADIGQVKLNGIPAVTTATVYPAETFFSSPTFGLVTQDPISGKYVINTTNTPSGTYDIIYQYKNDLGSTTTIIKQITIFASPIANINLVNSCVDGPVPFGDASIVNPSPFPTSIVSWDWNFGDATSSNQQNPVHDYSAAGPGTYNIKLDVMTDNGCNSTDTKPLIVGSPPVVDFDWRSVCNGDQTQFKDYTVVSVGSVSGYTWDFADGDIPISGLPGQTIPAGTHTGRTFGIYDDPAHQFLVPSSYSVSLTVNTSEGCVNTLVKQVDILPQVAIATPSITDAYYADFEADNFGWVASQNSSWQWWNYNAPELTNSTIQPVDNVWWTKKDAANFYNAQEDSYVLGPCFDLTNLTKPMIGFDYWVDAQSGFDGAVVQYSVDEGFTWLPVGVLGGGINWYNEQGLISKPGGQDVIQYGWSGQTGAWKNARYVLDEIDPALRSSVRIRMAFSSDLNNPPNTTLNGFAFDNIWIGERTKKILLESFVDSGDPGSTAAIGNIYAMYDQQFAISGNTDFENIEYHMNLTGSDLFGNDSPEDVSARSLYYGVDQFGKVLMNGKFDTFNGDPSLLSRNYLDSASLLDPVFDIKLDTVATDANHIHVVPTLTTIGNFARPVIFNIAVVEKSLTDGTNTYRNVLRKLLYTSAGMYLNNVWTAGTPVTLNEINWLIDKPILDPDNVELIAFVQDQVTKDIYQAKILPLNRKDNTTIVGLNDELLAEVKDIDMYPNPVQNTLYFQFENQLKHDYQWRILDQRGVEVLTGEFEFKNGVHEVDTRKIPNGIYYVVISSENRALIYKKLAVMNR